MRVGEVVAERFVLKELIGSGGMGDVHRALDRTTGVRVGLRSLRVRSRDAERFLREARVLAELGHAAIVRHVANSVSADGELYIAME